MQNAEITTLIASYGLTSIISFLMGLTAGFFLHRYFTKNKVENWERSFLTLIVLLAWVSSVASDIAIITYQTPVAVHGIMGLVVGYFFEGKLTDIIKKK